MRTYNRSLDYVALAMNELRAGKTTLAARLLATAVKQPDAVQGIAILEASNKYAFSLQAKNKLTAKRRVRASGEMDIDEDGDEDGELAADLSEDPLDDVEDDGVEAGADDMDIEDDEEIDADFGEDDEDEDEDAAATMAKVLSSMRRNQRRGR